MEKKLFLLDAFALIYRAYFAFSKNPRINSKGQNTSAAFGFTTALLDVINKEKPTHLAVVFDAPTMTNRQVEFSDYKANREEMPEDIRSMITPIKEIITAMNIPVLLSEGYEADDVIGTLAKKAEKEGFTTYMMTPDKDFCQLVSENIFLYKPARGGNGPEIMGVPEVQEKWQVEHPEQVIDILGLWGDAVDNIPGIPGIGEKTAKKLVSHYGSMENLFAHTDELKGKQKENVINFMEQGLTSKMLATIILDAPVEFNATDLILEEPNKEALKEILSELEFRNIARKILGEEITIQTKTVGGQLDLFGSPEPEPVQEEAKVFAIDKVKYVHVTSKEERKKLLEVLNAHDVICFDTETTGLNSRTADIIGLSFTVKAGEAYFVTLSEDRSQAQSEIQEFSELFENRLKTFIAHNFKYDLQVLNQYGVEVKGKMFDTMIAHYLINPDSQHGMDYLAELYLNYKPISIESLIGKKGKNQKTLREIPVEELVNYACEDTDITFRLYEKFLPEIKEDFLKDLFEKIEMPLVPVLSAMEEEGITLDTPALEAFSKVLSTDLEKAHGEIIELAGEEFNVDSPKQLGPILFEKLEVTTKAKKTKTGQYSTSEDVLSKLVNKHPIIPKILEYRSLKKLLSTYVDALPKLVEGDGRIHTQYMQTVAATGRLSSNNPNLQNIPIRTKRGREIRKAFIPRGPEYTLLAADYSQVELRVIASMAKEEHMIKAFQNGEDIHKATAAKVYGVSTEEVTRDQRSNAKAVNFGIIYGQSAFGLSENLGISRKEAKVIIDSYFEQYPAIRTYMDSQVAFAREHGYVETIMKRRRYLKDINSRNAVVRGFAERNAINAPIQGSAADIIKLAMIDIHDAMEQGDYKSKMLLQVHDELLFDVHKDEVEIIKELVTTKMENAVKMDVPLLTEVGIADTWLEAH